MNRELAGIITTLVLSSSSISLAVLLQKSHSREAELREMVQTARELHRDCRVANVELGELVCRGVCRELSFATLTRNGPGEYTCHCMGWK